MTESLAGRPPVDPELAPILRVLGDTVPRVTADTLPQRRSVLADGMPGVAKPDLTAGGKVVIEELAIPGPVGARSIEITVLRPAEGQGPWPAIYHTHGGGMVAGNRYTGLDMFVPYVFEVGAVVVSVEYRLTPEQRHPAPVEDCHAGLRWLAENAFSIGADPAGIMLAGLSAGGGLAAATALLARDDGFPNLTHQILLSPMLDDRLETPSSQMLDGEGIWDRNDNEFGWTSLLGDSRGGPDVSPYAAPARAADLGGLPRTFIEVGSVDCFRDEALTYAMRLSQAGVSVDLHLWGGGFHGSDAMVPQAVLSRAAGMARDEFLRRALAE